MTTQTKTFPEHLFELGYTDLVSVIPPGAALAPSSAIPATAVGKVPGRRLPNGLYVGYDWRKHEPTLDDVRGWLNHAQPSNVGLRADRFPGVDIDVTDPVLAQVIQDTAVAVLGDAPVRTGRAPKRLLMYRTDSSFTRMRMWITRGEEHHLIEVLGQGQQYVIAGTHPATLQAYAWDEDLTQAPASELTTITSEQVEAFLTKLVGVLSTLGGYTFTREGDGKAQTRVAGEQSSLQAPSLALLRQAVGVVPNTNELFPDRTSYLKMGYAIRAAGVEDTDEAYHIFAGWAGRWEGNDRADRNDPETVLADWRRMRGPYAVGWLWIAEQARVFGFDQAGLDFDTVADRPDEKVLEAPLYSDQWLADRVVDQQRKALRYVPQKGQYLAWSKGKWHPDAELLAEDIVKRELRVVADRIARVGIEPKEVRDNLKIATAVCSAGKVTAVASLVKSDRAIAVSVDALDHDAWILNTPAGIVNLKDGALGAADPDALCTKSTSVPPDFAGEAPVWQKFLMEATNNDTEVIGYLQRLCGYLLTGSTREQQLTFIFGPGGNGKSVFLNVLSGILGDYARVASMDTFTASYSEKHTTDVAMLTGSRLVTASETSAGKRWDEARIKSLTGGEPVTARFMRQDNFTFMPQFKLVFVGNHKPELREVDAAMKRRIQMVPFTVTPTVVDKELASKLRAEWPAILAWMIQGTLDWQEQGLAIPAAVAKLTEEYFGEEDAVGLWLKDRCEIGGTVATTSQDLYLSWKEWANQNGVYVGTLKRLSSALIAKHFERWQDTKTRKLGFKGIALRERDGLEAVS